MAPILKRRKYCFICKKLWYSEENENFGQKSDTNPSFRIKIIK